MDKAGSITICCPLCEGESFSQLARLKGTHIVRCRQCGLVYVRFRPQRRFNDECANAAYYEGWDLKRYLDYYGPFRRRVFEDCCARLQRHLESKPLGARASRPPLAGDPSEKDAPPEPVRVLDVGCSFGWFLDVARQKGWEGVGLEPSRPVATAAREMYQVDARDGGVEAVDSLEGDFDVITLWNVLEHLPEPVEALAAIRAKLKPGGLLAVSVPNLDGLFTRLSFLGYRLTLGRFAGPLETLYQVENEHMHLCHYSQATLFTLLERAGFATLEVVQQDVIDLDNLDKRADLESAGWTRLPLLSLPVYLVFHLSHWLGLRDEIAVYARRV